MISLNSNLKPYIVINNQGSFLTFNLMELPQYRFKTTLESKSVSPYNSEKLLGTLVVSEYNAKIYGIRNTFSLGWMCTEFISR